MCVIFLLVASTLALPVQVSMASTNVRGMHHDRAIMDSNVPLKKGQCFHLLSESMAFV